ncbi:tetratricopeptide repeat-containing sensor histidine kinase [Fibrella aquatilis]|uniref:histidine kinase n=1 Tax=Fibrella aquatilis TaxID=2817059 RepID=A0A939G3F0_9BACT|nr:tetratricopeptide repeat-containing sensor histidine kinase [Fibrella aquatilis]MBO0931339.1 tetratricopeptide repeat-containing sensor histidine kinase [Fibrella aquatilis]
MPRIVLLFFLLPSALFAQKQGRALIDSLVAELPKAATDTVKGRLYRVIAEECFFTNVDQALHYSQLGLQHTTRMKWQRGIGVFNGYIGRAYSDKGNYDSCRHYFLKAIAIYKTLDDTWNLASTTNNLGVAEQNIRSDYPAATRYYFEGLKQAEKTGDNYLIGLCLDNISEIYRIQKNVPKALQFGQRALTLRQQQRNHDINARRELAASLTSMAALYTQMENWPKARQYGLQALAVHKQIDNKDGLARTYGNLSVAMQRDYDKKIDYALRAKRLWDAINPRHLDAVNNLANLGVAYFDLVRYPNASTTIIQPTDRTARLQLAEHYLTEAIRLSADKGEVGDQAHFRGNLAELQALTGNYKGAYQNFRAYQAVQDSLYSQESKNKIAGLEGKREIDLRDKQLEINRLTIANQHRQQLALTGGLVLFLVIGGLLYWQNRTRKRTNTTLLRLNGELDEANRVKARFFAILSHDLRGPVANLISFLHLQRESPDLLPPDQVARHERNITEAAEGLLDTMESMLLWSKGQMQHFKPDVKQIPVETLFGYLQRLFAGVANVQLSFDAPDSLLVATDEDYLRTIMQNLTSNAINALKDTPNPTGGDAQIHWQAYSKKGQIILAISDNGPGMSHSQLTALYTDDAAISGKSGLGLHLIRDLARAISCQISVQSQPGVGTEFRLAFS